MNNITGSFVASDGREAAEFLEWWHSADAAGLIQLIRMKRPKPDPRAITASRDRLCETLRTAGMDDLIYADDHVWDVYHSIGTLKSVPQSAGKRGGKENIRAVPGMALDFDVKSGAFLTEEEITGFLEQLPVAPSATVSTGSGGLHAYWKWPEPLSPHASEALGQRWWALAQAVAGDRVVIDRIYNCDRILRTPGSVRWPKMHELVGPGSVAPALARIRSVTDLIADPDRVEKETAPAWTALVGERKRVRAEVHRISVTAQDLAGEDTWARLYVRSQLPEIFAERMSWPQILEPLGWFRLDEPPDREGRVHWARPGGDGSKSATTDWVEAPDSMSLFSTSPETGLLHLKDAGIHLTKYRVYVQLWWRGDERGFVSAFMTQLEDEAVTRGGETQSW